MKFMKLGTRPDSFYTEEAIRSVSSDLPSDLVVQVNDTKYLLHKFPLLPKCGLLQRMYVNSGDSGGEEPIALHDIPGGEDAFELCAKFCYGITISLSASNFVPAYCAAKFLRMTESVEKGNFLQKLEAFFGSCILEGWKDTVVALQTTAKLPEWSESLGIVRRCMDSLVEKILTHPSKVTWSYTYTRPGYNAKRQPSVPRDWWTEDIANLDIELFRCLIAAVRSTGAVAPSLIGEALHVYAYRRLVDTSKGRPPESSASGAAVDVGKQKRAVEAVVSMIPPDHGSVSVGFLLRLLSITNFLGASHSTKTELIRRSSVQLEEAKINDLLIASCSSTDQYFYDVDLVQSVLDSFLVQWRRHTSLDVESRKTIRKVAKLIDSYLQVIAKDRNMPVGKIVCLAESLPDIARQDHDELYKVINNYLKEHPDLSKSEKKRVCRILDCQKLSPEVCKHAVKNERLPLRTVVQVLYYDQERRPKTTTPRSVPHTETQGGRNESVTRKKPTGGLERRVHQITEAKTSTATEGALPEALPGPKAVRREAKDTEIVDQGTSGSKLEKNNVMVRKSKSEKSRRTRQYS